MYRFCDRHLEGAIRETSDVRCVDPTTVESAGSHIALGP